MSPWIAEIWQRALMFYQCVAYKCIVETRPETWIKSNYLSLFSWIFVPERSPATFTWLPRLHHGLWSWLHAAWGLLRALSPAFNKPVYMTPCPGKIWRWHRLIQHADYKLPLKRVSGDRVRRRAHGKHSASQWCTGRKSRNPWLNNPQAANFSLPHWWLTFLAVSHSEQSLLSLFDHRFQRWSW